MENLLSFSLGITDAENTDILDKNISPTVLVNSQSKFDWKSFQDYWFTDTPDDFMSKEYEINSLPELATNYAKNSKGGRIFNKHKLITFQIYF